MKHLSTVQDLLDLCQDLDPSTPIQCQVVGQRQGSPVWMVHAEGELIWPQNPNLYIRLSHPELEYLPADGAEGETDAEVLFRVANMLENL